MMQYSLKSLEGSGKSYALLVVRLIRHASLVQNLPQSSPMPQFGASHYVFVSLVTVLIILLY